MNRENIDKSIASSSKLQSLEYRVLDSLLSGYFMNGVRCCNSVSKRTFDGGIRETFMYRTIPLQPEEDMMLVYVHPSSVLSTLAAPHATLIYQDITTLSGKAFIKFGQRVDELHLARFMSAWKRPKHPLNLTSRTVEVSHALEVHESPVDLHLDEDKVLQVKAVFVPKVATEVGDARDRYLARKKQRK